MYKGVKMLQMKCLFDSQTLSEGHSPVGDVFTHLTLSVSLCPYFESNSYLNVHIARKLFISSQIKLLLHKYLYISHKG